jgi:hypothetical protein
MYCQGRPLRHAYQPVLVAVTEYWQASLPNTWENPAAGSVRVAPETVPPEDIVPGNSSMAELTVARNVRLIAPLVKLMLPPNWFTEPESGFRQLLVDATVPSLRTSRCAVITWPLASAPVQGNAVVLCSVNDQFPAAWVAVSEPPPPPVPMSGSELFSQPAVDTRRAKPINIGRTCT